MTTDEPYIIILNWNGKQDTLECLESLSHVGTPHKIIVVDNGSTDDSVKAISTAFPSVTLLETGENLGYAEGNNVGIRDALRRGATHLLILNNDTTVEPDFLDAFLDNDDAVQGAKPLLASDPSTLDHLGGMWEIEKGTFSLVGCREKASKWNEKIPLDYVCGCALFAKAEVFKKIGLFEPRFFLFWEESDWCIRAKRVGYQSYFCPEAKLYHKVSASFTGGKAHTTYFWWRNRLLWVARNCSKKEKRRLYMRTLIPEMRHILKLYPIKALQLALLKRVKPQADLTVKKEHLRNYKAALTGMKDYFFGRFGNGPSWIFTRSSQ